MSDDTTSDASGRVPARLSPDASPEMRKRFEERMRSYPIVQLRVAIFDADTGRQAEIQWQVFSSTGVTPDAEANLLDRVAQEIQGVRQRLEAEGFPDRLLDHITRELEAIPQRLKAEGFPGQGRVRYKCLFCGKGHDQVHRLIAGPGGVYICDECINLCREIIEEEARLTDSLPSGESGAGSEG